MVDVESKGHLHCQAPYIVCLLGDKVFIDYFSTVVRLNMAV